jgi:predicted acylesterase/phospholipase RssA
MKRILALDGGGIRGVFSLQILAKIEELFRKEQNNSNLVLADVFDLIAGTSTGAIIAASLSWGKSVAEIDELYRNHSSEIFAPSTIIPWLKAQFSQGQLPGTLLNRLAEIVQRYKAQYDANAIAELFKTHFTEVDGKPALLGTDRLKTFLLIVMRNGSTGGLWPVINNPNAIYNRRQLPDGTPNPECNLDFPLWQLLRASTAAPTFFPPEEIVLAGKPNLFMDGAMTPYNNPALIAVLTATLPQYRIGWPAGREALHVISVGTGLVRARMPAKSAADVNLIDHIRHIAPALIGAIAWEQDAACRVLGDCVHGGILDREIGALELPALLTAQEQKFTYARYDHPLDEKHPRIKELPEQEIALDDLKMIPLLRELGKEYAKEHVSIEHFHPRKNDFKPCKCSVSPPVNT